MALQKTRINELITNTKELAEYLGCSLQAINQFKAGKSMPKTENIIKMAEFYGVSIDYLLGVSDFAQPYMSVSEYTGLSKKAIDTLRHMGKDKLNALSRFLEFTEK